MKAVNLEPIREFWQSRFPKSVNVQIHTTGNGEVVLTTVTKKSKVSTVLHPDIPADSIEHDMRRRLGLVKITKKNYRKLDKASIYSFPTYDKGLTTAASRLWEERKIK